MMKAQTRKKLSRVRSIHVSIFNTQFSCGPHSILLLREIKGDVFLLPEAHRQQGLSTRLSRIPFHAHRNITFCEFAFFLHIILSASLLIVTTSHRCWPRSRNHSCPRTLRYAYAVHASYSNRLHRATMKTSNFIPSPFGFRLTFLIRSVSPSL